MVIEKTACRTGDDQIRPPVVKWDVCYTRLKQNLPGCLVHDHRVSAGDVLNQGIGKARLSSMIREKTQTGTIDVDNPGS